MVDVTYSKHYKETQNVRFGAKIIEGATSKKLSLLPTNNELPGLSESRAIHWSIG
jgi:hypothetical protein